MVRTDEEKKAARRASIRKAQAAYRARRRERGEKEIIQWTSEGSEEDQKSRKVMMIRRADRMVAIEAVHIQAEARYGKKSIGELILAFEKAVDTRGLQDRKSKELLLVLCRMSGILPDNYK